MRIGPGRPAPPDGGGMMREMESREEPTRTEPAGPRWFVRSDRNGDGAVTWAEFVGPRDAFDRLDADGDGALTPAEAESG